ncbi:MAG: hypothetical protein A2Y82_04160 [Candidatus Buchananbacteria bacterium RBG_13_36_9]|uniref:Uncharacterized protein n=1 Tax=Candidatus Buchananbacteria bacterium RBG_13_36_9 TaxID=1797530 RepID=A0A1G1XR75_9BACT|nr:MAG: hypothetical protein A2Y82_04160 [Candidatus Buchananbacteria bacterium RBG_13_36_9]
MEGNGIFSGTFLDEVGELIAKKQFDSLELDPVEEGEEVIGEMTDLEKAAFALFEIKRKEVVETCKACDDTPEDRASPKCARITMLKGHLEALKKLSWVLVEDRLQMHDVNLGIRADHKIVKLPDKHESGISLPGGLGIQILKIGSGR